MNEQLIGIGVSLIVTLSVFYAVYSSFRSSDWHFLKRYYQTDIKWYPFGIPRKENAYYEYDICFHDDEKGLRISGYIVPMPDGIYLYAGPLLTFIFPRLLIPWNRILEVTCKERKLLGLSYPYYIARIQTADRIVLLQVPQEIVAYANERRLLKRPGG